MVSFIRASQFYVLLLCTPSRLQAHRQGPCGTTPSFRRQNSVLTGYITSPRARRFWEQTLTVPLRLVHARRVHA
ncbi:hypothetical protein EXIGLDRAFT_719709, partial [Exidia glandulosa HHB12029]